MIDFTEYSYLDNEKLFRKRTRMNNGRYTNTKLLVCPYNLNEDNHFLNNFRWKIQRPLDEHDNLLSLMDD